MQTKKNIWIIDPYGEIPQSDWRDGRYFLMAKHLTQAGHNVILFISNFSHRTKKFTHEKEELFLIQNIGFHVVPSCSYKSNISYSRIKFERLFIRNMLSQLNNIDLPDCIILRDPALFISKPVVKFCKVNSVKLVVDIIDLWPELFELVLPRYFQFMGKFFFLPLYLRRRSLLKSSDAVVAVSPDYLDIARKINPNIPYEVIYWGCNLSKIIEITNSESSDVLNLFNISKAKDDFWIIYAGSLGEYYDIKSIAEVAKKIESLNFNIKFFIAGAGPMQNWITNYIKDNEPSNLIYLGSLKTNILFGFFKFCNIGLSTYSEKSTVSMPIKCYDYFGAGLPIINSLGRNLELIVRENMLGLQYIPENVDSLANSIIKLSNDPELYLRMKSNVLKQAKVFDDEVQYPKIKELVNSLF